MKRILALLMALAIFSSCFCIVLAEESDSTMETAVVKKLTDQEKATDLLQKLDIGIVSREGYITRQEFAMLIMQMVGLYDDVATVEDCVFDDVDDRLGGLMNSAVKLGYFTVPQNKKFRGGDYITVQEASAICVRALGYEDYVREKTMDAYVTFARKLELLDNVSYSDFRNVDANQMLYNLLHAECATMYSYENKSIADEEKLFIEREFGITYFKGEIEKINEISLTGENSGQNGTVVVDGTECYTDERIPMSSLGMRTEAYVTKVDDKVTLFALYPMYDGKVLTFNSRDIIVENDLSELRYVGGDKKVKYKLDRNLTVIYNYEKKFDVTAEDFMPESGKVMLTDNDRNGVYDLAIIESYRYYEIATVNDETERITDKNGNPAITLDTTDDNSKHYMYFADGTRMHYFTRLNEGDFLEVLYTEDSAGNPDPKKTIEIRVLGNFISGMVEQLRTESKTVMVDGMNYQYTSAVADHLSLGRTYSFVVGSAEDLVAIRSIEAGAGDGIYGYLVASGVESGFNGNLEMKIFTADGKMEVFRTADNLYYCGEQNGTYSERSKIDEETFFDLFNTPQLIKYALNNEGEIRKLWKAVDRSGLSHDEYEGYDLSKFTVEEIHESGRIYEQLASENYFYDDKSLMFVVPTTGKDEDYSVGHYRRLGPNIPGVHITLYDSNEKFIIDASVVRFNFGNWSMTLDDLGVTTAALISDVIYSRGADEEIVRGYTAYQNGKEITLLPRDPESLRDNVVAEGIQGESDVIMFSDLEPGDVIMYKKDGNDLVVAFEVLYRYAAFARENNYEPKYFNSENGEGYVGRMQTVFGKLTYNKPQNYFMTDQSETRRHNFTDTGEPWFFYEFDVNTGEITVLDALEYINDPNSENPDYVFVRSRRTSTRDVVIYRSK